MTMRRKEKIILLVALAGVIGLGVWLLYAWLYLWPEKAIERELAKIRARGEPVTLEELAPPEIPDAENAAKIYEQAYACYQDSEDWKRMYQIEAKDSADWSEEDIKIMRDYIEKNADCLRLLHEAANYDKCRFPLDYSQGYMMPLPHFSKMREFTRFLTRNALLKAKEGEIDEALESIWAGLRLGNALLDEPILRSQLVRIAIDGLIFSRLQKILDENDADSEILKRLLDELDVEESREAFTRCLQGERSMQTDFFEILTKDAAQLWQMVLRWGGPSPQAPVVGKGYRIVLGLSRPLIRRDEIFSLSIMRRMIDLSKLPYHQAKADLNKLEQDMANLPFYRILSKMFLPSLTRSYVIEARHEARVSLAQLALGLKIYKAEKGKYPDSLSELVPEILSQLPKDPFTGKDFVYKKEGEGFLVYSLNENARDDGGIEGMPSEYDIPWRCKR